MGEIYISAHASSEVTSPHSIIQNSPIFAVLVYCGGSYNQIGPLFAGAGGDQRNTFLSYFWKLFNVCGESFLLWSLDKSQTKKKVTLVHGVRQTCLQPNI